MKNMFLIFIILPMLGFAQVNRYSTIHTSEYKPITFEEMLSAYRATQRE